MADALLTPVVGGGFWAATLCLISLSAKKLKEYIDDRLIPLMGVLGAFVFAGQMINFTIPGTGSSGHIGGGMLLAILLGSYPAFLVISSVLMVQALFFADGGILALGCNIWNLGVYPCFLAYPLFYKTIVRGSPTARKISFASVLSTVVAVQLGSFSVVLQTKLSGISELPFHSFLFFMQPVHLVIGIVEGFITAGVVKYIRTVRPEMTELQSNMSKGMSLKKLIVAFGILALVTGGLLSWFASTHPDGLEWSIKKIHGGAELPNGHDPVKEKVAQVQEKTAFLPDYGFAGEKQETIGEAGDSWPGHEMGTSFSGLIGGFIVFVAVMILGLGIKIVSAIQRKGLKSEDP